MFKVGDLLRVRQDMTDPYFPHEPLEGDIVQVVGIFDAYDPPHLAVVLLRTGHRSAGWHMQDGWVPGWFDPLPLTPSNKDNDHEPTSR